MSQVTAVYESEKERARARFARLSLGGRDIAKGMEGGKCPPPLDPSRRAAAEQSFRQFCESYHPHTFNLRWSDDHERVIRQIETSVCDGGLAAVAMPRGSGKTSLAEAACEWALLYGRREFVCLICADEGKSEQMITSIKTDLETNDLLCEDFPEVILPIRALDGIPHRCKGQLYLGKQTRIGWTADEIIMPTMPDSKASGCIVRVASLTGGIRGLKAKRPDGRTVRPDLVVVDDPQTDQSARSPSQCATRERILAGAVLGLAGPGRKIAGVMPCTVITPGDMADNILNREKHPAWNGIRTKMVYSFPTAEKLWDEYRRLRKESLVAEQRGVEATEFYRANREAMDAGAVVAWEDRHEPDEISAIQHAMNIRIDRGDPVFFAEYQNEPLVEDGSLADDLTPDQVAGKLNRQPRGVVPIECNHVTAFIDVQASMLFWAVVAWDDGFSGYVLDYGTYPDQHLDHFTLREARYTLEKVVSAKGLEGQLYSGLEKLTSLLLAKDWRRDDGANIKIERCLIDANWGVSTSVIYKFCRQSLHSTLLTPSHGKYIGASSAPMREWQKKPGDRIGLNWKLPNVRGRREMRYAIFDTNYWKSFVHNRLATAMGDRGCLTLFGVEPGKHRLFADHITSEYRVRTQGRGREVDEWKPRPNRPDNHWLDCLVGCAVAASIQGCTLDETNEKPAKSERKRVSFSALQRVARGA